MLKLFSIRGATTAENNVKSITDSTVELYRRIVAINNLKDDDIVNVVISTTDDLTAFYPARAIRESGAQVTLFSCKEPTIDGALKGCIRLMVTAYTSGATHVYLKGARVLRPDISQRLNIAIDGPSGAGKSTIAKILAKQLGIEYLDTGALYRALGLKAINGNVDINDDKALKTMFDSTVIETEYVDGAMKVYLDGKDVSDSIRNHAISKAASDISARPLTREFLLNYQRDRAKSRDVVLDGRDIGTVVLPNANVKVYLSASLDVRAKRRYEELKARGEKVEYDKIKDDIEKRDYNDMHRKIAPLKRADDATEINSDNMTPDEVASAIKDLIKKAGLL